MTDLLTMKKIFTTTAVALLGSLAFLASAQVVRDSLDLTKGNAVTPAEMIRGQVAGVRVSAIDNSVNGALNTNIRGINELRGDSQPLWIINGVQLNSSLNRNLKAFWQHGDASYTAPINPLAFINPYDIESIEVIKDLSAAAIYGTAGANGVIIINTRMNKASEKSFRWNSNVSVGLPEIESEGISPAVSHNHAIAVSGNNNNAVWSVSAYLRDVNGVVSTTGNTYAGIGVNFETRANPTVWFGLNSLSSLSSLRSTTGTAYFGAPSMMLSVRGINPGTSGSLQGWLTDYDDDGTDYRSANSVWLTLNFTPWLSLKTSLGVDLQNVNRYFWYGNGTDFGLASNGAASVLASSMFNYNFKSELSANRYLGSDHHVTASLGVEVFGEINKFNTMNGLDFFSHELRGKGIGIAGTHPEIHKYMQNYNREGAFASLSYDWKKILGVDASFRADVTRKYYDWNPKMYPAASLWIDLKKAFLQDVSPVSTLRLHAGYGKAGRERYVPYGLWSEYCTGEYENVSKDIETFFEGINNVISSEINAGINLGLFSNRLNLEFNYYDKISEDVFDMFSFGKKYTNTVIWHYVPRTTISSISSTIANRGFELAVDARILDCRNLKWDVSLNSAYNVNQILAFDPSDKYGKVIGNGFAANINALGYQLGSNYGYRTDEEGNIIDITHDGRITEIDREILGSPIPKLFGSLGTTLSAFGLTLDLLAEGAAGFSIFNLNKLIEDGATVITDKYVEKGDYLRLSRATLSYDLPLKRSWVKGLRFSASGYNLLTLSNYSGWNPDVNSYGISNLSCGLDYGSSPMVRTFLLGVSMKF